MTTSLLYSTPVPIITGLLFAGIIIIHIISFHILRYQKKKYPEHTSNNLGFLEGALLGLLSLLLAFTFNKSASNYETRQKLLVQEANDIETAFFRSDLYKDSIRNEFRNNFKTYISARINYYHAGNDETKIQDALKDAEHISLRIWQLAAKISQNPDVQTRSMQMIPALNNMIDAMSKREAARIVRVPESIIWLLLLLTIVGSFIIGYASDSKKINWIILIIYSLMTVMTIYLILDLDRPRRGLIDTKSMHQNIEKLLDSFQNNETVIK